MGRTGRSMAAELAWPQIVSSSSGIRKLEQGVHVGLFQELRRKCRTFSGTVARVFINSDSARWESFEINRPFFTYSGNLHRVQAPANKNNNKAPQGAVEDSFTPLSRDHGHNASNNPSTRRSSYNTG